jgi:hypothetical protein
MEHRLLQSRISISTEPNDYNVYNLQVIVDRKNISDSTFVFRCQEREWRVGDFLQMLVKLGEYTGKSKFVDVRWEDWRVIAVFE